MKLNGIYLSAHQKTITKDMVKAKKKFFEYIPLKAKTCRNNRNSTHIKTKFLIYMAADKFRITLRSILMTKSSYNGYKIM